MKIGITIPDYYKEYLSKIANLNNSNNTKICSLIVENFLSFNLRLKKFPLFKTRVSIVFDENSSVKCFESNSCIDPSRSSHPNCQQLEEDQIVRSRDEILADLEAFDCDSED